MSATHRLPRIPALLQLARAVSAPMRMRNQPLQAAIADDAGPSSEDFAAAAQRLNALMMRPVISGKDLRSLVYDKWGKTYDVRLTKLQGRIYLQVMWKYLEQKSFPLTELEYMQQLDAVAEYLTEWGVVNTVKNGIASAKSRGPGYTGGGNAKCISIPLEVDLESGEWD